MSKLSWDQTGERLYETGVDRVVLFPFSKNAYQKGVAWNGVTAINENPSGGESNAIYADNIKYLNIVSSEDYGCTLEAYMSPPEFDACDGSAQLIEGVSIGQQPRQTFGLCWRSLIGNDTEGTEHGYKLHFAYGCMAAPTERNHETVNESVEPENPSWEISTTPVEVTGHKPTAHLVINSTLVDPAKLKKIEDAIYGTDSAESKFLLPNDVKSMLSAA